MFGKRKTATDTFILAKGREVGNIKKIQPPAKAKDMKGRGTAPKTAPVAAKTSKAVPNPTPKPARASLGKQGL